jgi:hypothetical protein
MSENPFHRLSAEQRENANAALIGAFGRAAIDSITPVTGGALSASTFRVDSGGRRYLLRVEGEPSPLRNPHQYVSMRIAAEAGIAPEIRYLDAAARIAVIDFIAQQPLRTYYAGVLLSASAAASWVTGDADLSAPSVAEFLEAIGAGRLKLGAPQTKHVLGKMFLASFMSGVDPPWLDAAV